MTLGDIEHGKTFSGNRVYDIPIPRIFLAFYQELIRYSSVVLKNNNIFDCQKFV